ncbi:MAG: alpha/beta fold hydrolase [Alphaproteobacteria bacterium]|nr:alpha/beta fold hydrolase [Alphaproteobacteria bacterium]
MNIDRAFIRLDEGLVHIRTCGKDNSAHLPVYVVHPSPASARGMEPIIRLFGETRRVIAPDTLGNGDSAAPSPDEPDITYFADSVVRLLDKLGLEKVDFYGSHTGGRTGCEMAVRHPDRVRRVVIDGLVEYEPELKAQILENYAPAVTPDDHGGHLSWALNFVRDQAFFFPYFMRDADHALGNPGRTPEHLHAHTVDVLKGLTTYHKAYLAAFRYPAKERMPQIKVPALIMAGESDPPHLIKGTEEMSVLSDLADMIVVGRDPSEKVAAANAFFDKS